MSARASAVARPSHSGPAVSPVSRGRAWRGSLPLTAAMTTASSSGAELPCVFTSAAMACPAPLSIVLRAVNPAGPAVVEEQPVGDDPGEPARGVAVDPHPRLLAQPDG